MGKSLAIIGLVFSLMFFMGLIVNNYLIYVISQWSPIIGTIVNLIVLIGKFEGRKIAIIGIVLNIIALTLGNFIGMFV